MKITGLKTYLVYVEEKNINFTFVQVFTDEGITGLGEGSVTSKARTLATAMWDLERMIVGKDPRDIEGLWEHMFRRPRWRGGPILNSAISAVDIALWDILGQSLGVPIWRLLGGKVRDRIRMYRHVRGDTPEKAAEHARALVSEGYTAVKMPPLLVRDNLMRPHQAIGEGIARVQAVREAVGWDVDIMLDAHGQATPTMAWELCRELEPLKPMFLEEPTEQDEWGTLEWLSQRSPIPLATGERLFTRYQFTDLCSRHLVSYIQPDVVIAGGISETRKIAAMAEAYYVSCCLHNPQSWVSTLASLHVDASTYNCVIQEYSPEPSWQRELFEGAPVIRNGYAELPSAPGLGLRLNEGVAESRPFRPVSRPDWRFEDGSLAEL